MQVTLLEALVFLTFPSFGNRNSCRRSNQLKGEAELPRLCQPRVRSPTAIFAPIAD